MRRNWIDVSMPLRDKMVHWPGDPSPRIERIADLAAGDAATVSRAALSLHTGTHIDAPLHFLQGGLAVDEIPLAAVIGPARVIGIAAEIAIEPDELRRHAIRRGERVLFRTRNSERRSEQDRFAEDYVFISPEAAQFLAARGVRLVGIDALSVDGFADRSFGSHHALLGAGIWIVEGLDLSRVAAGRYDLICLPLRIAGGEAAPARAVLSPTVDRRGRRGSSLRRPAAGARR